MKEGRIRPSLPLVGGFSEISQKSRNEGGSNSTLVDSLTRGATASLSCRNEGGSNSTLVEPGACIGYAESQAAMKEGRIRPSLVEQQNKVIERRQVPQ